MKQIISLSLSKKDNNRFNVSIQFIIHWVEKCEKRLEFSIFLLTFAIKCDTVFIKRTQKGKHCKNCKRSQNKMEKNVRELTLINV